MKGFHDRLALVICKIYNSYLYYYFLGCLICKCAGKFKELNDMHFILDMAWEMIVLRIE